MSGFRFHQDEGEQGELAGATGSVPDLSQTPRSGLVLIVSSDADWRGATVSRLSAVGFASSEASSGRDAERILKQSKHDLVVIDAGLPRASAFSLCSRLSREPGNPDSVLIDVAPSLENAVRAMRSGATDFITGEPSNQELRERLNTAIHRSRQRRKQEEQLDRLQTLCTKLEGAHEVVTGQVGDLCDDLVGAYEDLTERMGDLSIASELNSLLRQELDVESLLRTTLEYLLAKVGSTNAGIFLPSPSGEWTLGAYINYDCPKDSAEVMLDQLADVVAPRFEDLKGLLHMRTDGEFVEQLGEDAHWMERRAMLVTSCHDSDVDSGGDTGGDEECLAVVALFRNRSVGFNAETERLVEIVSGMFSQQLGRVIRTHYRHKPKDQWGQDDWSTGGDDLAA